MANITLIPAPRVAPFDKQGNFAREWYRFFYNLFQLTGSGTSSTTIIDLTIQPQLDVSDVSVAVDAGVQTALLSQVVSNRDQIAELTKQIQGVALSAPRSEAPTVPYRATQASANVTFSWDEATIYATTTGLTITLPQAILGGADRTVVLDVVGTVTISPGGSDTLVLPTTDTTITLYIKGNSLTFRPINNSTWVIV